MASFLKRYNLVLQSRLSYANNIPPSIPVVKEKVKIFSKIAKQSSESRVSGNRRWNVSNCRVVGLYNKQTSILLYHL